MSMGQSECRSVETREFLREVEADLVGRYDCPNCGHYLGDHIGTMDHCTRCLCKTTLRGQSDS